MIHGLHHVIAKKHAYRHLHSKDPWSPRATFDRFMYAISILAPLSLLPQLFEVWVGGRVAGVSLTTWSILAVVNVLWFIYGVIHKEPPLVVGGVLTAILNFMVVLGVILFR